MSHRTRWRRWLGWLSMLAMSAALLATTHHLGWLDSIEWPDVEWSSLGGVDSTSRAVSPDAAPETVSFELQNEATYFLGYHPDEGRTTARTLGELPAWQRAAAGVHVDGETPRVGGERWLYVADLLGVRLGARVTARLRTRRYFERAQRAAILGGGTALRWIERLERRAESTPRANRDEAEPRRKDDERSVEVERLESGKMTIERLDESSDEDEGSWGKIEVHRVDEGSGTSGAPSEDQPRQNETATDAPTGSQYRSVVLFGADWCPSCKRAKRWMERHDVSYTYRNVETSKRAKREMVRVCRRHGVEPGGIPTIEIGGDDLMQGWSAERFRELAAR